MQVHGEAEGDLEKADERDIVGEADEENLGVDDAEQEITGVDGPIKSEAVEIEVEGAEITVGFPLLGLLGFITASSPRVI